MYLYMYVYICIYMYTYIYIYIYTSQDPPISIGGARKEICTKRDHDQKGRSTNVIKKFDQQF